MTASVRRLDWKNLLWAGLVVLITVTSRFAVAPLHEPLSHDEAISVMHIAGKSVDYAEMVASERAPVGEWAPVSRWADYLTAERFDAGGILASTTRADLHPPLYFLSAGAWQGIFGPSRDAGWHINVIYSALGALAIFALMLRLTGDSAVSALSASVSALLPGAIETALTVRQYELLGMLTAVLAWRAISVAEADTPIRARDYVVLGVLGTLGLLTHVYYVLPMTAAFLWIALRRLREGWRTVAATAGALASGLVAAVLLSPDSFVSLGGKAARNSAGSTLDAMIGRSAAFTLTFRDGVFDVHLAKKGIVAVWGLVGVPVHLVKWASLVVLIAAALGLYLVTRPRLRLLVESLRRGSAGLFFFAWLTGSVCAMYVIITGLSAALGVRYMAMSWPFVGVLAGLVAMGASRHRWLPVALLCVGLVLANATETRYDHRFDPQPLEEAQRIVIDNHARGVLLPYVDAAPPGTKLYAAWRTELVATSDRWVDVMGPGDLVVIADLYQPPGAHADDLLEVVERSWRVEPVRLFDLRGTAYRIVGAVEPPAVLEGEM